MKFLRNTLESGIKSKQTKNSSGQRPEGSCLLFFLGRRKGFMVVFSKTGFQGLQEQVNKKFESTRETWEIMSMINIALKFLYYLTLEIGTILLHWKPILIALFYLYVW